LNNHPEICSYCHIGRVRDSKLPYTERFQEELILIPHVPARVCSYCGEIQYDPHVMSSLHSLLWADLKRARDKPREARAYVYRIDPRTRFNQGQFPPEEE
jgi:YgiT-type zinc finger domain-containing protein